MEREPKISVVKACCTQRQQHSQTPDRGFLHVWNACQQQERVIKKKVICGSRGGYMKMKRRIIVAKRAQAVRSGRWGKKIRCLRCWFGSVATALAFPPVYCEKPRTKKKEGWRECKNRWRELWRMAGGWTVLNDSISQWINGPWWASVWAGVLTQDLFAAAANDQLSHVCLCQGVDTDEERDKEERLKQR